MAESAANTSIDADHLDLPDKLFFRIGETASLVGVEPHVLRYWESEFRLRPQRSPSGQRMYRRKDIARFLRIRKLLHEEGFTIAGARKVLRDPPRKAAAGATTAVDGTRLGEGLERLSDLRRRLAAFGERMATVGVGGVTPQE